MQEGQKLRPGVALGAYPERREEAPRGFARTLHGLTRSISRRKQSNQLASVVQEIERHGEALAGVSSARLSEATAAVRQRLAREELGDELMQASFALVREVAGRVIATPHFDVQLMGGWVMARGMLAEMVTGLR